MAALVHMVKHMFAYSLSQWSTKNAYTNTHNSISVQSLLLQCIVCIYRSSQYHQGGCQQGQLKNTSTGMSIISLLVHFTLSQMFSIPQENTNDILSIQRSLIDWDSPLLIPSRVSIIMDIMIVIVSILSCYICLLYTC